MQIRVNSMFCNVTLNKSNILFCHYIAWNPLDLTLGARGFLREEPRSVISEAQSDEERENRQEVRKPLVAHDS